MTMPLISISPRQTFEDNMRPATLLLRVYSLLDSNDNILFEGELVARLREITRASAEEDLMLIYNEIFLGLVRESAQLPRSTLRRATLAHLMRQAIVAACTALETYLLALMRSNLPVVIRLRGRDFVPRQDNTVKNYLSDLKFELDETLRLIGDENASEYIAERILGLASYSFLSKRQGIHLAGALLGLARPWDEIANHLDRDKRELMNTLDETVNRRNDIVHRADRPRTDPGGDVQEIGYAWTKHAVDAINHICLALDELVAARIAELRTLSGE